MDSKALSENELKQITGGSSEITNALGHGKNGKPTFPLWDEASAGLIADPDDPGSGNIGGLQP